MFMRQHNTSQIEDVNWAPGSEVILAGALNLVIQPEMRALVQSPSKMEDRGTASDHLEVLSRMVKRYVNPLELGRGQHGCEKTF